jgi:hypothetical protein
MSEKHDIVSSLPFLAGSEQWIERNGDCWEWTRWNTSKGYGKIGLDGKIYRVHRLALQVVNGPILDGLVVDHLCRNPRCFNPKHLEAVTQKVNARRGNAGLVQKSRTHCPKGHEYNEQNTRYNYDRRGWILRDCRVCDRMQKAAKKKAKKDAQ